MAMREMILMKPFFDGDAAPWSQRGWREDASKLITERAHLSVAGSGDIEAYVRTEVNAHEALADADASRVIDHRAVRPWADIDR